MRLQQISGGVGSALDDGSRARLVEVRNRGIVGRDPVWVEPVWGPASVGHLVLAWWGTTTSSSVAPSAEDLRIPPDWVLLGVAPVGEQRSTYPSRWAWVAVVAARLSAVQAAAASWIVGEQDVRGLREAIFTEPEWSQGAWPGWQYPQAWALSDMASVTAMDAVMQPASATHRALDARVLPSGGGTTGAAFTIAPDWQAARPIYPGYLLAESDQSRQLEGNTWGGSYVGGDESTHVGAGLGTPTWTLKARASSLFVSLAARQYPSAQWSFEQVIPATPITLSLSSLPDVPMPPAVTSLTDGGFLDGASGHRLTWQYRPGVASAQTGVQVRRTVDSVVTYWSGTAWVSSPSWRLTSQPYVDLPADATRNGVRTQIEVRAKAGGEGGLWSTPVAVTWVDPPTASVRVVGADGGGVVADQTPTISTSATPGGGAQITGWEAQILTSAGAPVATTSGAAPTAWTIIDPLPNDEAFIARARVRQSGDMWSPWAAVIFTVHAVAPGEPAVTVTPTTHHTSGLPGLEVLAAFPEDGFPYDTSRVTARLQRSSDSGASWETIAVAALAPGVRSVAFRDWSPPTGVLEYRVRGEARDVDGGSMWGPWGSSGPVAAPAGPGSGGGWIQVVGDPSRAARLRLVAEGDRDIDLRAAKHAPLGQAEWVVVDGGPTDPTGDLTAAAWTAAEHDALVALLTSGEVLHVGLCAERELIGMTKEPAKGLTFRVGDGSVKVSRTIQAPFALRHVQWSWVTARPKPWRDPEGT